MREGANHKSRVGYFCSYFPKEILYAFGRVPVRVIPHPWRQVDTDAYLPRNFCSLIKMTLANFLAGDEMGLEAVAFMDSCDACRRFHDVWREYVEIEVLGFLDLPRNKDLLGQGYFYRVLRRFVTQLEARYGQELTAEKLAEAVKAYNVQRELLQSLQEERRRGAISNSRYYQLLDDLHTQDPLVANRRMSQALFEGGEKGEGGGPRVLLMGSLLVNRGLVELIEGNGARVVAEDSCADGRELREPIRELGDVDEILRDMAAKYLAKPPCPRMRDLSARFAYLTQVIADAGVDGLICSYYKFCDLFLAEFPAVREEMRRRGLPILLIEDEGEVRLSGQNRTRVEAFLEVLAKDGGHG
ncbi:MAG: 2-hydroxyacyl-CoA dehydratase subunit D [Anaerolineae bacterium]